MYPETMMLAPAKVPTPSIPVTLKAVFAPATSRSKAGVSGVAAAPNGKVYAMGGWGFGGSVPLSIVEEYNPATDSWATRASMPLLYGLTTDPP